MVYDVRQALTDPERALAFSKTLVDGYLTPAFGARSKSEIDLLVFQALVAAGAVDPAGPIYDLVRTFNITPAKARGLVLNWQLRATELAQDLTGQLVAALKVTRFAKDGTLLTFGIESPLLKEEIVARLKRKGVYADASFQKDIVRLPVDAFVAFLDEVVSDDTKKQVSDRLVRDKQLPDRSFKALATGVISKLGEKVAGEAGKALAGGVVDAAADAFAKPAVEHMEAFLVGLLANDVDGVVEAAVAVDVARED